jgi:hypothetical protein
MTGQKHAIECMVHLMSTGYVNPPMTFLTTHLAGLDGVCTNVYTSIFMNVQMHIYLHLCVHIHMYPTPL